MSVENLIIIFPINNTHRQELIRNLGFDQIKTSTYFDYDEQI